MPAELLYSEKRKCQEEISKFYAQFPWQLYGHFTTCEDITHRIIVVEMDGEVIKGINWRWKDKVEPFKLISDSQIIFFWKRYAYYINRRLYGDRYKQRKLGISWVIGIEDKAGYHKHIHALIGGIGVQLLCRKCLRRFWEWFTGLRTGMARIDRYDAELGRQRGAFYLAKHQIKRGNIRDFFVEKTLYYNPSWLKLSRKIAERTEDDGLIHLYWGKRKACEAGEKYYQESRKIFNFLHGGIDGSDGLVKGSIHPVCS